MTLEEERALVTSAQGGNASAINQLILAFRPLVISHARRCAYGTDLDDAIQEGTIGLYHAIQSCDLSKSDLRAYAKFKVRYAMQRWRKAFGRHYSQLPHDADDELRGRMVPPQLRTEPTQELAVEVGRLTARERASVLWDTPASAATERRLRARVRDQF